MKFLFSIFTIILVFISCNKIGSTNIEDIPKDTIKIPENISVEKNCLEKVQGYKNRYGIVFSNYYNDESLGIDFDNNKTIDTVTVLKPYYENNIDDCYSDNLEFDFPILLISKTINKKSKIFKIFKNVLKSNTPVYYEEITTNKSGFVISKDITGNNGFYTKTYVSFKYNNLYIDSLYVESWGLHQYKKTIRFRNKAFELSRYKRTDVDSVRNVLDNQ
ncbi:hypothetical protein [Flavobacterium aquidurense]|uniref:Lipoprotein n=1 Tax=Flavobacterium aquidurense TaxID=362413 RepID=A0A0Q0RU61_9FLAO|nr:hypothetical protein [Flavobacterium aquidurense]KQB40457.1 hypothetical protein RC62_347 [Flavobacterium aquidurense]